MSETHCEIIDQECLAVIKLERELAAAKAKNAELKQLLNNAQRHAKTPENQLAERWKLLDDESALMWMNTLD